MIAFRHFLKTDICVRVCVNFFLLIYLQYSRFKAWYMYTNHYIPVVFNELFYVTAHIIEVHGECEKNIKTNEVEVL